MEDLDAAIRAALPEAAVLTAPPAPVATDWAADLLQRLYGMQGQLKPLTGERDANFLLEPAGGGARCMLKLSHPDEDPLVADFQTQALLHVARTDPGLPVQRLLPDRHGAPSAQIQDAEGRTRVARVFSYLEGLPMPQAPRSAAQRSSVARMLARLDRALAGLEHPAAARELPWDIQRADRVRPLLVHVADPARRALAEAALAGFEQRTKPKLAGLRRQPIHNDFNLYNLLVDPADPARVSGILDFGDMVHAPLVDDLAVAASYHIDEQGDALATIAQFAADYHAVSPLTDAETMALLDLVRARLSMVVAISGWRAARQPENAPYLMRNNAVSWARLQACADLTPEQVQDAIHAACRTQETTHA
ncbi:phosphotransferase [Pseudorhodoferax sp. Leaf265]|uniref:phosphotransferase n=1 Tax=Pseudorhodoferax sp. Leaf265 TaxID=1736315 RepID=UPI0006FBA6B7|nr:phosphotransferase [Pseudorhodoferax sp. Leaf265]KQP02353.1 aminoglycoside phosphotransferase [Pseudorhodoferax sp. Leaf265]PZP91465.1 MAG: aminoglycoside phosphotransferase [Variovorax paradoxus]PZQ01239.1 MAG: aminoglycoside phosphotransferase [Variovorax paradoxus]